ncbi:MAG: nitrite reductase small subunit NirD [Sulfuricellaceae bacterium]|nr:nitrite reductase small subunit NirD [Sulfuricellaceae bacterium]
MSEWLKVCRLDEIPRLGARVVKLGGEDIAVFRNGEDRVFAMRDKCPHKGGPLSQGIVAGNQVTCPLHGMNICLNDGKAIAPDEGCARTYAVRLENNTVFLQV